MEHSVVIYWFDLLILASQYNEREVTRQAIQDLVARWKLPFYETSAKKNWHINDVFEDLTRQMRKRFPNEPKQKRRSKKDRDCIVM